MEKEILPLEPDEATWRPEDLVGHCLVCGKEIYYSDKDIHVVDRREEPEFMICDSCFCFQTNKTPEWIMNLLAIEHYRVTAKQLVEEVF